MMIDSLFNAKERKEYEALAHRRGKSGGCFPETELQTVLLTIYSKTDQSDLPTKRIRRIIDEYEN